MSKLKFHTKYDPPTSPRLHCSAASLARQEFVRECDLSFIMDRYSKGMAAIPKGDRPPLFGDFSNVPDYQDALQCVIDAQDRFAELPAAVRDRFRNDPGELLAFLSDPANKDEAVKLGLISAPVKTPENEPQSASPDNTDNGTSESTE